MSSAGREALTAPAASAAHNVGRTPAVVEDTPPPAVVQTAPLPPSPSTPVRALSPVNEPAVLYAEEDFPMDVDAQIELGHLMDVEADEERTAMQPPATVEPEPELEPESEPELTYVPPIPCVHFDTIESADAPVSASLPVSYPSPADVDESEIDELTEELVTDPRIEPVPAYRHRPKAARRKRKRSLRENVGPDQHPAKRQAVAAPAPEVALPSDQPAVTQPPPPPAPPARAWACIPPCRDLSKKIPKARQCAVRESAAFIKRAPATSTGLPQSRPQSAENNTRRAPPDSSSLSHSILDEWKDGLCSLLAYLEGLEKGTGEGEERHPQLKTRKETLRDAQAAVEHMESSKGYVTVETFMYVRWPAIRKKSVRFVDGAGSWTRETDTEFAERARSILRRAIAVIEFFEERAQAARAGMRTGTTVGA